MTSNNTVLKLRTDRTKEWFIYGSDDSASMPPPYTSFDSDSKMYNAFMSGKVSTSNIEHITKMCFYDSGSEYIELTIMIGCDYWYVSEDTLSEESVELIKRLRDFA